jgi:ribonuclease HI
MPCKVNLYTDSAYVFNAFTKGWIDRWQNNNWKTSQKTSVENQDLWRELIKLSKIHSVNWIKVKGHSDNEMNNRCDKLARESIKDNLNLNKD